METHELKELHDDFKKEIKIVFHNFREILALNLLFYVLNEPPPCPTLKQKCIKVKTYILAGIWLGYYELIEFRKKNYSSRKTEIFKTCKENKKRFPAGFSKFAPTFLFS